MAATVVLSGRSALLGGGWLQRSPKNAATAITITTKPTIQIILFILTLAVVEVPEVEPARQALSPT
jgi:hypothetical protein